MKFSVTADTSKLSVGVEQALEAVLAGLEEGVADAAHALRDDAKRTVPVDTGKLRDGIGARVKGLKAEVAVFDRDTYYGQWVEHGTSSRPAQPFMLPAAERERSRFVKRLIAAVGKRTK